MCFRICSFLSTVIKTCIYITIDMIVFFVCWLDGLADSVVWPGFRFFYGILKAILKDLFEEESIYTPGQYDFHDSLRGNDYVEDLLRDINDKYIDKPFVIEDKVARFQNSRIIPIKGQLRLCPILLMRYRLMRSGICLLVKRGIKSRLIANIKGCQLRLECDIEIKIANFIKTFHVTGDIPYFEAYLEIYFNNETSEDGDLTDFILLDMHAINLSFNGASPLNSVLNFIGNNSMKLFKRRVKSLLQKEIRSQLTPLVENYRFPVAPPFLTEEEPSPVRHPLEITEAADPIRRSSPIQQQRPEQNSGESMKHIEQQRETSESAERSSPAEQQRATPESAERLSPTEQQRATPESAERSSPAEQQRATPESAERSSPTEQQRATPESAERSPSSGRVTPERSPPSGRATSESSERSTLSGRATPESVERSPPAEQQRAAPETAERSPPAEQQIQATSAEYSHSRDGDSSPEMPPLVNLTSSSPANPQV